MRSLTIVLVLFLAACNGSDSTPANTFQAQIDALKASSQATETASKKDIADLKDQLKDANKKFSSIQLFMNTGQDAASNLMVRAILNNVDFGPCDSGGIKIGGSFKPGSGPLDEQFQAFKQAATETCPGVNAEYEVATGNLKTANRIYFDAANCQGNAYEFDAGGQGYDRQKIGQGVAFIDPFTTHEYWVAPGTQSQTVQAASVFVTSNGACAADADLLPMWLAVPTDTQTSGVPLTLGDAYQVAGL